MTHTYLAVLCIHQDLEQFASRFSSQHHAPAQPHHVSTHWQPNKACLSFTAQNVCAMPMFLSRAIRRIDGLNACFDQKFSDIRRCDHYGLPRRNRR
jgi:hypothetical protein